MLSVAGRAELRTNDLEVVCSSEFEGCSIAVTSKYFGRLELVIGTKLGDVISAPSLLFLPI